MERHLFHRHPTSQLLRGPLPSVYICLPEPGPMILQRIITLYPLLLQNQKVRECLTNQAANLSC